MPSPSAKAHTAEIATTVINGWPMLAFNVLLLLGAPALIVITALSDARGSGLVFIFGAALALLSGVIVLFGYFTLQPNEARVLILFGAYQGTVRNSGFYWANPLLARHRGRVLSKSGAAPSGSSRTLGVTSNAGLAGLPDAADQAFTAHAQLQQRDAQGQ